MPKNRIYPKKKRANGSVYLRRALNSGEIYLRSSVQIAV